jgi:hypothetical protein
MSNGTNFLALWRPGNGAQYWSTGLTVDDFKAKDLEHFKQGLRLVSLRVNAGRFTGIWHPGTGAQWWSTGLASPTSRPRTSISSTPTASMRRAAATRA